MMVVHQAIYGDKSGAYALLKTSLDDTELAKRICNVTDLIDRPPNGYLTNSVFRGFVFNDYYLFIKTFPDNDPMVRKGRVMSHVLIVEQDDLHHLINIEKLFRHFLSELDKDPCLDPIVIDRKAPVTTEIINYSSREAEAINGLLNHSHHNNTIVWIGEEGYIHFIARLWAQLDGNLRATIKLGIGFNPQKIDTNKLNIIYVMEEYESKWKTCNCFVVGKCNVGVLTSTSSFLLAGCTEKSKPLIDFIKTFGIVPTEIEDLLYLEKLVECYEQLSPTTDFNRLIALCDLISKYSPDQSIAKKAKHDLLTHTTQRIASASPEQIMKLMHPDWDGFSNGISLLAEQISDWVTVTLFDLKSDNNHLIAIGAAFDSQNEVKWWKKAFYSGLSTTLSKWKSTYATVILDCFIENPQLVKTLGILIPTTAQAESDLVRHWRDIDEKLAQNIRDYSKDRMWLTLHGLSTLQLYAPDESIKWQLEIDTDIKYSAALERMGDYIPDIDFLHLAVKYGDGRLVKIAGTKVAKTPSLFNELDITNIVSSQIWLAAIRGGNKPWESVSEPFNVLYALMEQVLNGSRIDSELLIELSSSDYNDLSQFNRRSEVWQCLSGRAKDNFLNASVLGCVKLLDNNATNINILESEVLTRLVDREMMARVVNDKTINASTKIQLFEELPKLLENEFVSLLCISEFSVGQSERIGKLILIKRWNKAINYIVNNVAKREDLKPALIECQSLLGFFEKMRLSLLGVLSDAISREEWWSELTKQCYKKYPSGPAHNGLWERAGGKNYDLPTNRSGRESWVDAVRMIRNKCANIDTRKLLKEMLNDFSSSDELIQLERNCFKYVGK